MRPCEGKWVQEAKSFCERDALPTELPPYSINVQTGIVLAQKSDWRNQISVFFKTDQSAPPDRHSVCGHQSRWFS